MTLLVQKVLAMNVYENILAHDPNDHVPKRSTGVLRTERLDVSRLPRGVIQY